MMENWASLVIVILEDTKGGREGNDDFDWLSSENNE